MIRDYVLVYLFLIFMFATIAYAVKKINKKNDIFLLIVILGAVVSIVQYETGEDFLITGGIMLISAIFSLKNSLKGLLWE